MDNETLMEKRFLDLSRQAQFKDIVTFSDFLTLNELDILYQCRAKLESSYQLYGGYDLAERQMVAFLPDALYYDWEYPIDCLEITYTYPKFAEKLTHRDVLGTIMSLGIDRNRTGDILFDKKENKIYLFCEQDISDYLMTNLTRIRHTEIKIRLCDMRETSITPDFEELNGIVSSTRLDSMVACMAGISRSQAVSYIQQGKVFINGKQQLNNSYQCKPGEIYSIRTVGKFIYSKNNGETHKGKIKVLLQKYN